MAHASARLKVKHVQGLMGNQIVANSEAYDTISCSECLNQHSPGRSNVYSCCNPRCKAKVHRDESAHTGAHVLFMQVNDKLIELKSGIKAEYVKMNDRVKQPHDPKKKKPKKPREKRLFSN